MQAEQVCAVTDGAEWLVIGSLISTGAMPCGFSISPTPQSHFGLIAEALEQHGYPLPVHWVPQPCHDLKQHGPADVLERLRSLPATDASEEHLHYLEKREALMQYPTYRAAGWPIGSGMVESGNKVVMQTRLKGAGMRLRTAPCQSDAGITHRRLQ